MRTPPPRLIIGADLRCAHDDEKTILAVLLYACAALPPLARAALLSPDPTGLWYNPDESGWGLALTQQADTIFAVLFVYDPDGRPAWYVASAVQLSSDNFGALAGPTAAGALYRTSGPYFATSFDPHAVTSMSVGNLAIGYNTADGKSLSVAYTINGARVRKTLVRQTWRDTRGELFGRYLGEVVMDAAPTGCSLVVPTLPLNLAPSFSVGAGGAPGDIHVTWGTGIDTVCSIDGTYAQDGAYASIAGFLTCGPVGGPGTPIRAEVYGIHHDDWGVTGGVAFDNGTCHHTGHLGGVRLPL